MKNKENHPYHYKVPQENIFYLPYQPTFEEGKKIFDPINYEIFLFDVNDQEFRCDGKKYIAKVEGSIFNSPSPHLKEIIQMTIEFVGPLHIREKLDAFLKRVKTRNMDEFFKQHQSWDNWFVNMDYVYPLRPEITVDRNSLKFYKFFLPFKLKHVQPENVGAILDYHRYKYFKKEVRSFNNILTRMLSNKDQKFWFHKQTPEEIQIWIDHNIPKEEVAYWFELKDKYDGPTKKSITALLFHDLQYSNPPFLDLNETYHNFGKLFSKPNNKTNFSKVSWVGKMGELNYFVKSLIAKNKIDINARSKWIICSNLFLVNGEEFTNETIGESTYISKSSKTRLDIIVQRFKGSISQT